MHDYGSDSTVVRQDLEILEQKTAKMAERLDKNTILMITADHGHTNLSYYYLSDYPDIVETLSMLITVEPRAVSFHVKNQFIDVFAERIKAHFSDSFYLMSRNEILSRGFLGIGVPHPLVNSIIGDYIAVAVSDKGIVMNRSVPLDVSHHAGLTKREVTIPLIAFQK